MFSRTKETQQTDGTSLKGTHSAGEDGQLRRSITGHPSNLSATQEDALHKFREEIAAAGLYVPRSTPDGRRASHTDVALLRFLRARRFDVGKAMKQFTDEENWRRKYNVDELYLNFPVDEMEASKKFYPTWTGRRDRRGLPIYVYRLADLDSARQKELSVVSSDRRYQRIIALYEYMLQGVLNLCAALAKDTPSAINSASGVTSSLPPSQVSSVRTMVDLAGVSLSQLWNIRSHLQQASNLATANYPETLNSIFVLNAPGFFPTAWNWFQGFFDQGTREKIKILGNPSKDPSTLDVMTRYIAKENIPKAYGGDLDWTTGDDPKFDEPTGEWLRDNMNLNVIRGPLVIDPWGDVMDGRAANSDAGSSVGDSGVGIGGIGAGGLSLELEPPSPGPVEGMDKGPELLVPSGTRL
ncbi:CRAL-TRIO domain-containing protein [Cantharellus anzutake]|uniref:CRAL-TRIO domain-containing protein n=1 Tax=Cantharellus anzutake TaxID=1750568 RepID=UPI00190771C4|nr:CRAL-TRIO domain-containing protein [Cantharellus anzutake]KAF8340268.1 CRAL-TRIO domain-containing protein [Cantharellus anzutake]